jgi:hypothetical protein
MRTVSAAQRLVLSTLLFLAGQPAWVAADPPSGDGLVIFGVMHEVIGMGRSQARVALPELALRPHFYGVGAAEGLGGEITFVDSKPTLTSVGHGGQLQDALTADARATLFIGQSVTQWKTVHVSEDIPAEDFDRLLLGFALQQGISDARPFMFLVEGGFQDVKLHVINGACPVHARSRGIEIASENQPYELSSSPIRGTMVGVHAHHAAGRLTHPGTTTHRHLVFHDDALGRPVTGHIEQAGILAGARIRLATP